jgi:EKC/KEOPS complex subunit CGI121/TPRKB
MALESIALEHLPASHTVHTALFRNVKNASFLHQQLLAGNKDFEYALIDASVVSNPLFSNLLSSPLLVLPSPPNHVTTR